MSQKPKTSFSKKLSIATAIAAAISSWLVLAPQIKTAVEVVRGDDTEETAQPKDSQTVQSVDVDASSGDVKGESNSEATVGDTNIENNIALPSTPTNQPSAPNISAESSNTGVSQTTNIEQTVYVPPAVNQSAVVAESKQAQPPKPQPVTPTEVHQTTTGAGSPVFSNSDNNEVNIGDINSNTSSDTYNGPVYNSDIDCTSAVASACAPEATVNNEINGDVTGTSSN